MENKTVTTLKELGIYEHVLRHNAACMCGGEVREEEPVLPLLPAEKIPVFSPDNEKLGNNYIFVYPTQIGEIKALAGVAEKTAAANAQGQDRDLIRRIMPQDLSDLNALAYRYLILSEAEMDSILEGSEYGLDDVKKHILNTAQTLPVLCAGGTLEVKDGEVVRIRDTAVAVFENVVIHGSGTIEADTNTKIVITNRLEHV